MSVTFKIKASEAQGRRLDPRFYHPVFRKNRVRIEACEHSEVKALCGLSNEIWDKGQCFQDHFPYVEIGAINCENGEIGNIEELATVDAPRFSRYVWPALETPRNRHTLCDQLLCHYCLKG